MSADTADVALARAMRDAINPPDDAFRLLQFWPNCRAQTAAAQALGCVDIAAAVARGHRDEMPEACGECPQERFLAVFDEPNTDTFYGGSAGSGKSAAMLLGALRACRRHPGLQAFWFRESFPNLSRTVIRTLERYGFAKRLGTKWNSTSYELKFANGSSLTFAYVANAQQAQDYLSAEINLLLIDERTQLPADAVDLLYSRVRSGVAGVPCLGIRSASNPGGIAHAVVRREYVESTRHGELEYIDASGRLRRFIVARLTDTPQLDPQQYAASLAGLSPDLRRRMLEGDWSIAVGQVFSEWRHDRHVVADFPVLPEWRRWGGIDWGMRHPSAVTWAAEDNDGRLWVYREIHAAGLGEKGLADAIKAKTDPDEHVVFAFDPSMGRTVGDALPVSIVLQQAGIPLVRANNDRLSGWARLHSYLAEAPICRLHAFLAERGEWEGDTCPLMHIFASCTALIESIPALPYAERGDTEDAAKLDADLARGRIGDDMCDSLRYLCMQLGTTASPMFFGSFARPEPIETGYSVPVPPSSTVQVSPFV